MAARENEQNGNESGSSIIIEKPPYCNLERPMLHTKRESDLIDHESVEPTSLILGACLNMLHSGRNLERPLELATIVFWFPL